MKITKELRDATRRNFEALSDSKTFVCLFNEKMVDEVLPLLQMGLAVYLDKPIVPIVGPTSYTRPRNDTAGLSRNLAQTVPQESDGPEDDALAFARGLCRPLP